MQQRFIQKLDRLNKWRVRRISNRNFLLILAFVVGSISGLAAAGLKSLTHFIASTLQDDIQWQYKYFLYLIFPLIGILLSVIYIRKFLKGKRFDHGLTPVIYAVSRKSSRLEPHNIHSQVATAALTVGFGGSTGLEAPIVYSGSAIGSNIGRFFGLNYKEVTMLLACGAASGISAAFNSPIAGVIFAIEILLTEFSIPAFIPLLIASASGAVISKLVYNEPMFYTTITAWKVESLIFYVILAIFVGLFTVYFAKLSQWIKKWFNAISNPYRKVWISGISLGLLILIFPTLYGEGYLTIQQILDGHFTAIVKNSLFSDYKNIAWVILAYTVVTVFAKAAAALVTINGGGNGGVFGPSLVIGGLIGFVFAFSVNQTGFIQLNISNFVMAGMAGALSGIMHAPLTGIFLIAEITGGYILMVPLMIVSSISYFINRAILRHSIYTKALADSGDLMSYEDKDRSVLSMMKLRYVLETNFVILYKNESPKERQSDIIHSKRNIFPILDDQHNFLGIVYSEKLFSILLGEEKGADKPFHHIVQAPADTIYENENMDVVMTKMNREDVWILPVLDQHKKYIGFVSKSAVFNKYRALLMRQADYLG